MSAILDNFWYYFLLGYCTVAVCKFVLVMPSIPVAIAVASWHKTGVKGYVSVAVMAQVTFFWAVLCFFWWIPRLAEERAHFFVAYRKFSVIRDALNAYRSLELAKATRHHNDQRPR